MRTDSYRNLLAATLLGAAALTPAHAQIDLFEQAGISVTLNGREPVPAVTTTATGDCTGRLVPASGALDLACTSDVAGAGAVILTRGAPGPGAVEIASLGSGSVVGGEISLSQAEVALLLTGQLFVAVTSGAHPSGEIAARLIAKAPTGMGVMRFPLRRDSLVNTGSTRTASCAIAISGNHATIRVLCSHDVTDATQLRVVIDGGVVATVDSVASPFEATLPILSAQYDRFLDGDFGLVLASAGFPQGELGMVLDRCIDGPNSLCLNDDRFRVTVVATAPGGSPDAADTVPARASDSGLLWFFDPAIWEVLVKVLDGCGVNQNFWVFFSANTSVAYTATIYDTLTGRSKVYSNPQGHIADPVADIQAFPCN
jgi:hypothetical protein